MTQKTYKNAEGTVLKAYIYNEADMVNPLVVVDRDKSLVNDPLAFKLTGYLNDFGAVMAAQGIKQSAIVDCISAYLDQQGFGIY